MNLQRDENWARVIECQFSGSQRIFLNLFSVEHLGGEKIVSNDSRDLVNIAQFGRALKVWTKIGNLFPWFEKPIVCVKTNSPSCNMSP